MSLPQKDLKALHVIRALQPMEEEDIPRNLGVDIIKFTEMDLAVLRADGYWLTEKGQAALRDGY